MNDETKTPEPATKEDRRKAREEHLAHLRSARRTFWLPPLASHDEQVVRLQKTGPEDVARETEDLRYQNIALRNAQAWLHERLLLALQERDALEAAYREEKAERESAERQRWIDEAALSARCEEITALKARLRERKRRV